MNILIVPTVREIYQNQFEYCVDKRLIFFLKKTFKKSSIEIYNAMKIKNYDLIILSGGNNSIIKNKADIIRNKLNEMVYKSVLKKKIKILGICHGAHFLAKKLGFILKKKVNHVGSHEVIFNINKKTFTKNVNSYHKETIKFKINNSVNIFGVAKDNTIEAFHVKSKNLLGVMWHPERYTKYKNFDISLIKKFYATNCIVSR
tara:strand:- start:9493 stop:10098 length:606 start_codon:yes stop_codon:yes gene_type:complete